MDAPLSPPRHPLLGHKRLRVKRRLNAVAQLTAYAAEYGFILRYPQDRQAATGVVFEPWHWRYVGVENALAIRASGLSLEEFLALRKAS
mgnify:CR=1 FL=1